MAGENVGPEDNDDDKDQGRFGEIFSRLYVSFSSVEGKLVSSVLSTDLSDNGDLAGGNSSVQGSESSPRSGALNYSSALNATSNSNAALVSQSAASMSTETLLLNIQEILKVAVENARQKDRQNNYDLGKLHR